MPTQIAPSTGQDGGRIIPRPLVHLALAAGLLLAAIAPAWADIPGPGPRPRPRPQQDDEFVSSTIRLKLDPTAIVATLNIPKETIVKLAGNKQRRGEVIGFGTRTIVAGLAMSAALVSLMFVLRRRLPGSRRWKIATASVVGVAATLGALELALADVLPPKEQPTADPQVEVVAVSNAKEVTLLIPPNMLKDLKRLAAEAEEAQSGSDGDTVAPGKNAAPASAPAKNAPTAPGPVKPK